MRLIDADELKKCAIPCEIHNGALTDLCVPLYQIDNAPTVIWCSETPEGLPLMDLRERPQGEWGKWIIAEVQCPKCFEYFETDCYSVGELNKCPSCGAQMEGGADMRGEKE